MIELSVDDFINLIHWSRRYCDERCTYAPSKFNDFYDRMLSRHPQILKRYDVFDDTLMHRGAYFPYAQDGHYNQESGFFDARSPFALMRLEKLKAKEEGTDKPKRKRGRPRKGKTE